ncbi:MAG: universal stress protein, partial [Rhodobacteraceae bacterium]|nr:universal stress protein [Paracoccaceae bacterium]
MIAVAHVGGLDDAAGAIVDAAKGAGMIVAGAYGHRGWREWLLGTTTE